MIPDLLSNLNSKYALMTMSEKASTIRKTEIISSAILASACMEKSAKKKRLNPNIKMKTLAIIMPTDNSFKPKSPLSDLGL